VAHLAHHILLMPDLALTAAKGKFRYMHLAERLAQQIRTGMLQPGEQLPSIRLMSQAQGLSISTVSHAYYLLVSQDLVEARPQSGYYVRETKPLVRRLLHPSASSGQDPSGPLAKSEDLIAAVYGQLGTTAAVQFSVTGLNAEMLPIQKLARAMKQAVLALPAGGLNYQEVQGDSLLRRQIARHSLHWDGPLLTEHDLVITEGCSTAMAYCLMVLAKPGDTVAMESPAYFAVLHMALSLGLQVLELPTCPVTGICLAALEEQLALGKVQVCLLTPSFSNPLGCTMPEVSKERLVRLLDAYDVPLIEDDIYRETYFGKARPKPCKAYDQQGRVLWCSSVSKTLAPGYRVGWVAPGRYLEQVKRVKFHQTIASPTMTQRAIALFMAEGHYETYMHRLRWFLRENHLLYRQALQAYFPADVRINQPRGGFKLWLELPAAFDTQQLYHEAIQHGISIAPGQMFTLYENYNHCFGLSFGIPFSSEVDACLRVLGDLVRAQYQQRNLW
jgi:DNA-binding transcriptional MocR family regulator